MPVVYLLKNDNLPIIWFDVTGSAHDSFLGAFETKARQHTIMYCC